METQFTQCINKGMQRDYSADKASQEFAYENKNIRITTTGNESFLTVTNEKSTELITTYIDDKITNVEGTILGSCVLDNYLVLFVHKGEKEDFIYRGTIDNNNLYLKVVYSGDLNLSVNNPIECITCYESSDVKKVYWVDGLNQPRIININTLNQTKDTSIIDFVPNFDNTISVDITKEYKGAGDFPSGVVQYYITYYKKFGQESNVAYKSPIYYISSDDRGGEANTRQSCSFRLNITNVDTKYDYIRVYSLIRSSKDTIPEVYIVGDINIDNKDGVYQIIDTNTNNIAVAATDIMFLGGDTITASTIEQKDNTLFLGNITTLTVDVDEDLEYFRGLFADLRGLDTKPIHDILRFVYKIIPINNQDDDSLYPYTPELISNVYDSHFKLREKYRVGLQFCSDSGEETSVIYIDDIINEDHYPHYMSQEINEFIGTNIVKGNRIDSNKNIYFYNPDDDYSNIEDSLLLPTLYLDFEDFHEGTETEGVKASIAEHLENIKKKGFNSYKLVIANTEYGDGSIVCQGYVNPLIFRLGRRIENDCYSQPSWTIRPIGEYKHLENINKCDAVYEGKEVTSYKYTDKSEIRSSINPTLYTENCFYSDFKDYSNGHITNMEVIVNMYIFSYMCPPLPTIGIPQHFYDYRSYTETRCIINGVDENGSALKYEWSNKSKANTLVKNSYNSYRKTFLDTIVFTQERVDEIKRIFKIDDVILRKLNIAKGEKICGESFLITEDAYKEKYKKGKKESFLKSNVYNIIYYKSGDYNVESVEEKNLYKENFFLDASGFSFYTPDIDNITNIVGSGTNLKCRIVGKADIDRCTSDCNTVLTNINWTDIIDEQTRIIKADLYNFSYSKISKNKEPLYGTKNFISVYGPDSKAYSLMMFDRDGAPIANYIQDKDEDNDLSPVGSEKTSIDKKVIGNLWYSPKTDYEFHWRVKKITKNGYDRYFPKKDSGYKSFTNYNEVISDITDLSDNWGWYSDLIHCDLDISYNGINLWNEPKYINGNVYLNNIDDIAYYEDWGWYKTNGNALSITSKSALENDLITSGFVKELGQVRFKYDSSNHILVTLNSNKNNVYTLPGYNNGAISNIIKYCWDNTTTSKSVTEIDKINYNNLGYDDVKYIRDNNDYSDIFYVKKQKETTKQNIGDHVYIVLQSKDIYAEYYSNRVVSVLDWSDEDDLIQENERSLYCKYSIVYSDNSFSFNNALLFKGNRVSDLSLLNKDKYGVLLWSDAAVNFSPKWLFPLNSTLRGNNFFNIDYKNNEYLNLPINVGFIPNYKFDHYLPFNTDGIAFLEYPVFLSTDPETFKEEEIDANSNSLNNSIWICELYKDFEDFDFLGGTSENAIEANTFIPASNTVPIGHPVYGLYGDTYYKRWDSLRIYPQDEEQTNKVVDIVSVMLETRINLDGDTRTARKRLDIGNIRPTNIEDTVNPVYSQKDNYITSKVLDEKFNVSKYPTQYWWSLPKIKNADIDNWTKVNLLNVMELDQDKGPLNKIKNWNNRLYAFQDKGISLINFNNQTTISSQEGVPVEIANSGRVTGSYYLTTTNGCKNKWSIIDSPYGLYFIDSYNKSINVISDSIKSLSTLNLFEDWIVSNENGSTWLPGNKDKSFKSFYDPIRKEVYFVNGNDCLCYNELLQQFTSFYDYEDIHYMETINGHIYALPNNNIYRMFEGDDYCNLFGKTRDYYIKYKVNHKLNTDKVWTNLEYRADIFTNNNDSKTSLPLSNETFDTLKVWNEYQEGVAKLNQNKYPNAVKKFRTWRVDIPRDNSSIINQDRIRNPWIFLELKKETNTDKRMEFHDLLIKYLA